MARSINDDDTASRTPLDLGERAKSLESKAKRAKESQKGRLLKKSKFQEVGFTMHLLNRINRETRSTAREGRAAGLYRRGKTHVNGP